MMTIGITAYTYLVYLGISIALTIWVARTLHKNGRVFLVDVFHGNEALADSVNHLLVVGFYLINVGYVSLVLKSDVIPHDLVEAIEIFSHKIGVVLLVLCVMQFINLKIFAAMRHRAQRFLPPPPVQSNERTALA